MQAKNVSIQNFNDATRIKSKRERERENQNQERLKIVYKTSCERRENTTTTIKTTRETVLITLLSKIF